ncbi:MAG: hypothetical protein K2M40_02775 [Muribaculaceae bacterium]|nr:hypothetical protein [Muribaculaceae bacterium]
MNKPIIFRFLALSLLAISAVVSFAAPSNKVVTLNFDEDMFEITVEDGVVQDVLYTKNSAALPNDTTLPSLPIVAFTVAAGPHVDCTFSPKVVSKKLILEDVDIITAPPAYPTSMLGKVTLGKRGNYAGDVYPSEICTLTGKSEWSDATHLHFLCSPFIYDGKARRLYLIEQLDVDITTTDALSKQKLASENFDFMTPSPEFIQTFPGLIDTSLLSKGDSLKKFPIGDEDYAREFMYDYLIITSEKLASTFEPLLRWKKAKGLQTHLETVESISKHYSGVDTPAKIKDFLRKNATRMGIKYVLLGGDDTVIPVRYCDGNDSIETDKLIPADLYYACVNDPYDWDKNGNGIYGEIGDDISMAQSFAVTRVPVNTTWFAKAYVDKVLQYETDPRWHNNFFMGGYNLKERKYKDETDVYASSLGHLFYKKYIQPERNFSKTELFNDTNTLGYKVDEALTVEHLVEQFSRGYNFVSFITHGSQIGWSIGTEIVNDTIVHPTYFTANAAGQQNHSAHTLITTMACQTNAFDMTASLTSEASLSEMFIRNANSGVIGYLGSSRAGYFMRSNYTIGPSQQYEGEFYKYLFNPENSNSFGVAVEKMKATQVSYASSASASRYVMFGLNPLGDPEMPIFTQEPLYFNAVYTKIDNRSIEISNVEEGCVISIQGFGPNSGYSKLYKNRTSLTATELPDMFTVCVSKDNYVPVAYAFNRKPDGTYVKTMLYSGLLAQSNFGQRPITGQILDCGKMDSASGTAVEVTTLVSESASSALIQVTQSSGSISNTVSIPTGEHTAYVVIQNNSAATIIISLIVDGVVQESKIIRN